MKSVRGTFGNLFEKIWPCTYSVNGRGGMDEELFEKYVHMDVAWLFPDADDVAGKRVIFKCDGGPGRMNVKLLAKLRAPGIYVYPSIPNTTAVSHETEQLFSLFKSAFQKNLDKLTSDRLEAEKSVSFNSSIIGLLVFRGTNVITNIEGYQDAFATAFSPERNRVAWATVGATSLAMACLNSDKVQHDKDNDPHHVVYKKIQDSNHTACDLLTAKRFHGYKLRVQLKRSLLSPETVTKLNSQARIEVITAAKTHGARFLVIGGGHLCTNNIFKAMELKTCREKREILKKDKAVHVATEKVEKEALAILETKPGNAEKKFTGSQLQAPCCCSMEWRRRIKARMLQS